MTSKLFNIQHGNLFPSMTYNIYSFFLFWPSQCSKTGIQALNFIQLNEEYLLAVRGR